MENKKFRNLKVDDTIVVYMPYSTRFTPTEGKITKVGREYVYAKCGDYAGYKFTKDTGYGEYGYYLFPGTLNEYKESIEVEAYAKKVIEYIESNRPYLTRESLDKVMSILKGDENENN